MKKEDLDFLEKHRACEDGLKWARTQSDLYELWNNCHRGDWLLWLAKELQVDKKKLMLCGALCAHTVMHLMPDSGSREAVRITFLYARDKATKEQLQRARSGALHSAYDANTAAAAACSTIARAIALNTAWAAHDAAYTAADAWAAAYWAARAIARANGNKAKRANQLRTAEITRRILTQEVFEKIGKI